MQAASTEKHTKSKKNKPKRKLTFEEVDKVHEIEAENPAGHGDKNGKSKTKKPAGDTMSDQEALKIVDDMYKGSSITMGDSDSASAHGDDGDEGDDSNSDGDSSSACENGDKEKEGDDESEEEPDDVAASDPESSSVSEESEDDTSDSEPETPKEYYNDSSSTDQDSDESETEEEIKPAKMLSKGNKKAKDESQTSKKKAKKVETDQSDASGDEEPEVTQKNKKAVSTCEKNKKATNNDSKGSKTKVSKSDTKDGNKEVKGDAKKEKKSSKGDTNDKNDAKDIEKEKPGRKEKDGKKEKKDKERKSKTTEHSKKDAEVAQASSKLAIPEGKMASEATAEAPAAEDGDEKINSSTHHKEYLRYRRWIKNGKRFPTVLGTRLTTEDGRAKLFVDWVKCNGDVDAIICKHEQSLSESKSSQIKYGFRSERWLVEKHGEEKAKRIVGRKTALGLLIPDPEEPEDNLYFCLIDIDLKNINELKRVTSLEAKGQVSAEMIKAFTDAGGCLDQGSLKMGELGSKDGMAKAITMMGNGISTGDQKKKPKKGTQEKDTNPEAKKVTAETPQSKAKTLITKVLKDANTCRLGIQTFDFFPTKKQVSNIICLQKNGVKNDVQIVLCFTIIGMYQSIHTIAIHRKGIYPGIYRALKQVQD